MPIKQLFGKKKKLGFTEKHRTRKEVDEEYTHHAAMHGHITRLMWDHQKLLDQHMEAMTRLNNERAKLLPDAPKPEAPAEIKPEGPEAA